MPLHPRLSGTHTLRRAAPLALLIVAASAVVSVAATGSGLFLPAAELSLAGSRGIRVAGLVVGCVALAALFAQGRRLREDGDPDTDHTGAALASAALIMSMIAVMAFFAPGRMSGDAGHRAGRGGSERGGAGESGPRMGLLPPSAGTGAAGGGSGRSRTRGTGDGGSGRPELVENEAGGSAGGGGGGLLGQAGNLLMLVLLLVAALIGFRLLTGQPVREVEEPARDPPIAVADAAAGLEASLGEVAFDGKDPRGQITAAYHRLLAALAAAGVPREPQEAPYEYLHRALAPLGVRAGPMHTLTGLYVTAQFSDHPLTERHRAAAVEALEDGLHDIRAAPPVTAAGQGAYA